MALTEKQIGIIKKTLPGGRVFFNFDAYPDYTHDAIEEIFIPEALFFAESEAEIVLAVKLCAELNIPLIMRGAGTGYTGGALAIKGGLLVSIERMNKLEIDVKKKIAICGPGVITADVVRAAEKHGLFYPPDPASYEESTIGGNVAENAGGLRGKKYGVTKDYVLGFRAVTASGEIIEVNQATPFGLMDILIGSEGTLCAFSEFCLRLIDLPRIGQTIQAIFGDPVAAAMTISEILAEGIVPCIMEYMDGDAIDCSNKYDPKHQIASGAAMVLIETDGPKAKLEADHISQIIYKFAPIQVNQAHTAEEREILWKTRRNLSKAVKDAYLCKISEDVCVPPSRLPELVQMVEDLNNEFEIRVNCYGHAGDGNLHVNFLGQTGSDMEKQEIDDGVVRLFEKTIELGGTLTGEHGIGTTKKEFLNLEFDRDTIELMKSMKFAFDPDNRLNPGKMFPD